MNLAVHGLAGDIRQGNSYYEDLHNAPGKFDFVMANPPFNVDRVDKERLKDDTRRFPFGMPRADNANYLWIQLFYSSLSAFEAGRGFVMANSASDARQSELEIRKGLVEAGAVDVMVAVGSNFFYTVTLPCTLWFLDKGKTFLTTKDTKSTKEEQNKNLSALSDLSGSKNQGVRTKETVLFIDARNIYTQIDRAHREWTPEQIGLLASLVRLYRGEDLNGFTFNASDYPQLAPAQIDILQSAIRQSSIRRRAGTVQSRHTDGDRSPGLEPEPGPLRGRQRPRRRWLRLRRTAGRIERGTGTAQRRSA